LEFQKSNGRTKKEPWFPYMFGENV
jgi:hypothetical protein